MSTTLIFVSYKLDNKPKISVFTLKDLNLEPTWWVNISPNYIFFLSGENIELGYQMLVFYVFSNNYVA